MMTSRIESAPPSGNSSSGYAPTSTHKISATSSAAIVSGDHSLNSASQYLTYRLNSEEFASHTAGEIPRLGNRRASCLFDRYKAIYDMTRLPEEHPYHLPSEIAYHAKACLALLLNNSDLEVPQLINRGGEALSLTWRTEDGKVYLTIDDTDVDLFAVSKEKDIAANLISDGRFDWARLLTIVNVKSSSDVSR